MTPKQAKAICIKAHEGQYRRKVVHTSEPDYAVGSKVTFNELIAWTEKSLTLLTLSQSQK